MREKKDDIIYTAEDIKRYLTGDMLPADMHAMEMAALDDPLLAEAMEGYELMEQKDWGNELAALKGQLNNQPALPAGKEEKKLAPVVKINAFKKWRATAAVAVLGITAVTAYLFTNKGSNEPTQQISAVESAVVADSGAIAKTDSVSTFSNTQVTDTNQQLIAKVDNTKIQSGSVSVTTSGSEGFASIAPRADSTAAYRPAATDYAVNEKRNDETEKKEYKPISGESAASNVYNDVAISVPAAQSNKASEDFLERGRAKDNSDKFRQHYYAGVVTTPDNKPVSYASITLSDSRKAVYTDAYGAFNFKAADTNVKVTVSSAGYTPKSFTLQNTTPQNKIVLQPQDVAAQTISVGKKREAARMPQQVIDSSSLDAEPTGGWVEYNDYLSNNLHLPQEAKQKNIHGEVELTVKLKENGEISTVKVAKPLCDECDAEAIRLVKEGPKFDVKASRKNKVKVKVKF